MSSHALSSKKTEDKIESNFGSMKEKNHKEQSQNLQHINPSDLCPIQKLSMCEKKFFEEPEKETSWKQKQQIKLLTANYGTILELQPYQARRIRRQSTKELYTRGV